MADSPAGSRFPPRYREIADYLRAQIEDGSLGPGDQLEGQVSLMNRFGVAMSTVVRALDELRREGLVATKPGLGTFVVEPKPSPEFEEMSRQIAGLAEEVRQLRETVAEMKAERQQAP